jgi:glucosamine--fructose-6-phosphate aminotransferase (isomerizing)
MEKIRNAALGSGTMQEIRSQTRAWSGALQDFKSSAMLRTVLDKTSSRTEWLFVGCGTSFYLAEAAAASWKTLTGQSARAVAASEILLFPALTLPATEKLQAVVISRSGSTSEAVRAAAVLRNEHRIPTLGLTCTPDSPLEATCELTIRISAADETSMVMTRSFTSMLLVMQYLAAAKGGAKDFCVALETLAQRFAPLLPVFAENLDAFTAKHNFEDYIFLGQGPFQGIVREAALKVTEMSCSYSQSFHTLEFRHGPKSIVTSATCLTFFISEQGKDAECEVLAEMKKLGGVILTVCNVANETIRASSDLVFELGLEVPELATLAPFIVSSQLLGCYTGIKKGLNPDAPKNLTRVVLLD